MTEKLFYKDAYIKEFEAECIDCVEYNGKYAVILDKTAFFPEGGGQKGDVGKINNVKVIDTVEENGEILHITETGINKGMVKASLDWQIRFAKMQNHTAEHVFSGLVNKKYGLDNVGFHLGDDFVAMDYNGILSEEDILSTEYEANKILWADLPVKTYFPAKSDDITYRCKKEIKGNLRIVGIEGVDICACCAPHISSTAQAGIIKVINCEKHKSGVRLTVKSGDFAFREICSMQDNITKISRLISVPRNNTAEGVEQLVSKLKDVEFAQKDFYIKNIRSQAENSDKSYMFTENAELMKEAANILKKRFDIVAVFSGSDGDFKFMMLGDDSKIKAISEELSAKCGGRNGMLQGTVKKEKNEIEQIMENIY